MKKIDKIKFDSDETCLIRHFSTSIVIAKDEHRGYEADIYQTDRRLIIDIKGSCPDAEEISFRKQLKMFLAGRSTIPAKEILEIDYLSITSIRMNSDLGVGGVTLSCDSGISLYLGFQRGHLRGTEIFMLYCLRVMEVCASQEEVEKKIEDILVECIVPNDILAQDSFLESRIYFEPHEIEALRAAGIDLAAGLPAKRKSPRGKLAACAGESSSLPLLGQKSRLDADMIVQDTITIKNGGSVADVNQGVRDNGFFEHLGRELAQYMNSADLPLSSRTLTQAKNFIADKIAPHERFTSAIVESLMVIQDIEASPALKASGLWKIKLRQRFGDLYAKTAQDIAIEFIEGYLGCS